jgi:hypothetical protein
LFSPCENNGYQPAPECLILSEPFIGINYHGRPTSMIIIEHNNMTFCVMFFRSGVVDDKLENGIPRNWGDDVR